MDIKDKVVVTYKTNYPKLKFVASHNGLVLASGSNAQELGEKYAREYCTDWLLDDGQFLWSKHSGSWPRPQSVAGSGGHGVPKTHAISHVDLRQHRLWGAPVRKLKPL